MPTDAHLPVVALISRVEGRRGPLALDPPDGVRSPEQRYPLEVLERSPSARSALVDVLARDLLQRHPEIVLIETMLPLGGCINWSLNHDTGGQHPYAHGERLSAYLRTWLDAVTAIGLAPPASESPRRRRRQRRQGPPRGGRRKEDRDA